MPLPPDPTVADVYRARQVVGRYLPPTPLLRSRGLSALLGADVHVKYENCSPVRSFKARGGVYCASSLSADCAGVACASTGNHGQGMAFGARIFGKRALVCVPEGANPQKMAAIRQLGGDLREVGADLHAASEAAQAFARSEGLQYVEDGEDRDVMLGCATLALELQEQLPHIDALLVPTGGGNLLAACALVMKTMSPRTRLVGVQSAAAPAVYESWRTGAVQRLAPARTFAGGLATSYPGSYTFAFINGVVDEVTLVDEEAILDSAALMLRETGHLPEGASAAGLAALLQQREEFTGQTVVLLLTGGNYEASIWEHVTGRG